MNKDELEQLENKYAYKMTKSLNPYPETGHFNCDNILEELLEELGMVRTLQMYRNQDKWYS